MSNSTAINKIYNTPPTHSVLIGAPLIVILAFAFGFVLLQPAGSAQRRLTSATQTASSKTSGKASSSATVEPVPLPSANLPTLTPAPVTYNSSLGSATDSVTTASPQSAAGSGSSSPSSTSGNLQSAVPNHQVSGTSSINTRSSTPESILTNLLNRL